MCFFPPVGSAGSTRVRPDRATDGGMRGVRRVPEGTSFPSRARAPCPSSPAGQQQSQSRGEKIKSEMRPEPAAAWAA